MSLNNRRMGCGTRISKNFMDDAFGRTELNEFPWTCMVLTKENKFVANCAIIPNNTLNDISYGTERFVTTADIIRLVL